MANVQSNAQEVILAKYAPYQEFASVLENVDMDRVFRTAWISGGAPAENLTDFDKMIAERQEKQQLELAAAQSQIGESASKAYKNVSSTPEAGSLAETVI